MHYAIVSGKYNYMQALISMRTKRLKKVEIEYL